MSHLITDFTPGMMVRSLDTGEQGQVDRIDEDGNIVYVRFSTANGPDILDVDPGDLEPLETRE